MKYADIVNDLLFNFSDYSENEILAKSSVLSNKLLRWLGTFHPDNRSRKIFLGLTNIEIGKDTVININFIVSDDYKPLLKIGARVAISPNVTIICVSGPNNSNIIKYDYVINNLLAEKEIIIKDDVWIGANAVILPGIEIGEGAVVGAGAVVTRNIEPFSVVGGIPAKLIRKIN